MFYCDSFQNLAESKQHSKYAVLIKGVCVRACVRAHTLLSLLQRSRSELLQYNGELEIRRYSKQNNILSNIVVKEFSGTIS